MKTMRTVCLLLTVVVLGTSCKPEESASKTKQPYPPGYFAQQMAVIESANVTNDVSAAIQKGDFRFLVCVGWGGTVPGVPDWNDNLYKKYGTRVFDGTGDLIVSDEQRKFKRAALSYAEAYNRLLWSRVKDDR